MSSLIFDGFLCGGRHRWCHGAKAPFLLPCLISANLFLKFFEGAETFSKKFPRKTPR